MCLLEALFLCGLKGACFVEKLLSGGLCCTCIVYEHFVKYGPSSDLPLKFNILDVTVYEQTLISMWHLPGVELAAAADLRSVSHCEQV